MAHPYAYSTQDTQHDLEGTYPTTSVGGQDPRVDRESLKNGGVRSTGMDGGGKGRFRGHKMGGLEELVRHTAAEAASTDAVQCRMG